jgi:hypothetical protein
VKYGAQRVYRSSFIPAISILAWLAATVALPFLTLPARGARATPLERVLLFALSLVVLSAVMYRFATSALYATEELAVVRNPFRTFKVPWADIERFTVDRYLWSPAAGYVQLRNGTRIRIWGVASMKALLPKDQTADHLIVALNRELAGRT